MKVVYLGAETKILLFMEILSKDNIKKVYNTTFTSRKFREIFRA
jgi:hypothetical protein